MGDHDDDVRAVVANIWETLFAREISCDGPTDVDQVPMVASYVSIEGTWQGGILMEMPVALASELTREILVLDGAPTSEQVCDALGEMCNVLAGNFKALVPAPSHLSLPVVTLGSDYHFKVIGAQSASVVPFTDRGGSFLVTVHEGPEPI